MSAPGFAKSVFFYPIQYAYMADTQDPFDFTGRNPLQIKLQRFYYIIRVGVFSLFPHGKRVAAALALIALAPFYDAAFDDILTGTAGTGLIIHS